MIVRFILIVILIVYCQCIRQFSISIDNLGDYTFTNESNINKNSVIRQFDIIDKNQLPVNERWSLVENNRTVYDIQHNYQIFFQEWIVFDAKTSLKIARIKRRVSNKRIMYEIDSKLFGKVFIQLNSNTKTYLIIRFKHPIGNITQLNDKKNTYFVHFDSNPHPSLIVFVALSIFLNI